MKQVPIAGWNHNPNNGPRCQRYPVPSRLSQLSSLCISFQRFFPSVKAIVTHSQLVYRFLCVPPLRCGGFIAIAFIYPVSFSHATQARRSSRSVCGGHASNRFASLRLRPWASLRRKKFRTRARVEPTILKDTPSSCRSTVRAEGVIRCLLG